MPRPSNTEQRRSEIAQAMLSIMARDGYERASIAAIARCAGLAPGLIHYHFRNKQEILLAVIDELRGRVRARYRARLTRASDDPPDPVDRLFALVDAHVALDQDADQDAVAAWVAIGAEAVSQANIRAAYADAIAASKAELVELFAACLRGAGRPIDDADRFAVAVLATIEGAYQLAAAAPDAIPAGFAAPTLRRMIHGLLAEEQ